jgi:outer membrane protein assembly factor BamB
MRYLAIVLLLACQDNDHLLIKEVEEGLLHKWSAAEAKGDFNELMGLYAMVYDTKHDLLARPDPEVDRWIPVCRVLAAKLASLPPAALEAHELIAKQVLDTVLEPAERRKAIEKYAYTKAGREALDQMANADCDAGRLRQAMRSWSRALEVRPSAETVARLSLAHALQRDGVSLTTLKTQAQARGIKGEINVGGRKRELFEFLDSLKPPAPDALPLLKPSSDPTTEIPLGHYDMKDDGRYGERLAVSLPAVARVGGKDLVIVSNGLRVIAIDPARADGGTIEDTVEWRYPKPGPTRTWTLGTYNSMVLPFVGPAVAGDVVICPIFPEQQVARQQMGRRSQKFLGASSLRALKAGTGELLWDTDTTMVEVAGSRVQLLEHLKLDNSDFCFGGPPVVRGDRVYAPVMTSPWTGRQCWVLCLDARSGQPIWCTDLGTAPQAREMSVALLSEEDGTIVIATNYGVVAALDSATGSFEWLSKYMGESRVESRPKRPTHRAAASPPVIAGSLVYVLPQDCDDLVVFDRWTGLEVPLPKLSQDVEWRDVVHLLGRAGDWLVVSGPKNAAIRPLDGQVVMLPDSEPGRLGRGVISGERLYLPTPTELSILDTRTWKVVESLKWPERTAPGNALVAGPLFVHMGERLDLYTSLGLLKSRFGLADGTGPARPQEARQLAGIFENAGLLKQSVPYYRKALRAWEKDPDWTETSEGLKKKLADLAEKLGDDFPKE